MISYSLVFWQTTDVLTAPSADKCPTLTVQAPNSCMFTFPAALRRAVLCCSQQTARPGIQQREHDRSLPVQCKWYHQPTLDNGPKRHERIPRFNNVKAYTAPWSILLRDYKRFRSALVALFACWANISSFHWEHSHHCSPALNLTKHSGHITSRQV